MKKTLISMLFGLAFSAPVLAASAYTQTSPSSQAMSVHAVASQIEDMEWSVRHSSVAQTLDAATRDRSLALLRQARAEVAAGNLRTAEELVRRAGRPLVEMAPSAMSGKHPNELHYVVDIKATMASIIDTAEQIAIEKSAPSDFVAAARAALREGDALAAAGQTEAANNVITAAYGRLQTEVARLRSGDEFILDVPKGFGDREWADAMRRFDDRIQLSRYLLIEAQAEGVDVAPLVSGMAAAETSLSEATRLALEDRWDQAYRSMNLAYLQLEESWKGLGVEW